MGGPLGFGNCWGGGRKQPWLQNRMGGAKLGFEGGPAFAMGVGRRPTGGDLKLAAQKSWEGFEKETGKRRHEFPGGVRKKASQRGRRKNQKRAKMVREFADRGGGERGGGVDNSPGRCWGQKSFNAILDDPKGENQAKGGGPFGGGEVKDLFGTDLEVG